MRIQLCVSVALCLLVLARLDAGQQQPADRLLSDEDRQVLEVVLSGNRTRAPVLDLTWPMCGERVQSLSLQVASEMASLPCFSPGEWNNPRMWPGVADVEALKVALRDRNASSWRFGTFTAYPTLPGGAAPVLVLRSVQQLAAAYPDLRTVLLVGAPGFSADRQRALIYMESRCTSRLCSEGSMMLVERDGSGWRSRGLWGWGSAA